VRQIVEWGFANVVLALAGIPLASALGSVSSTIRVVAAAAFVYLTANVIVLVRRRGSDRDLVRVGPLVVAVDVLFFSLVTATVILGDITALELTLIVLVARPMIAFLMVLGSLGREDA